MLHREAYRLIVLTDCISKPHEFVNIMCPDTEYIIDVTYVQQWKILKSGYESRFQSVHKRYSYGRGDSIPHSYTWRLFVIPWSEAYIVEIDMDLDIRGYSRISIYGWMDIRPFKKKQSFDFGAALGCPIILSGHLMPIATILSEINQYLDLPHRLWSFPVFVHTFTLAGIGDYMLGGQQNWANMEVKKLTSYRLRYINKDIFFLNSLCVYLSYSS